jgi:glutamyl-tRNA synthetase
VEALEWLGIAPDETIGKRKLPLQKRKKDLYQQYAAN